MQQILNGKEFPEYPFAIQFPHVLFADLDEALCNQLDRLMEILSQVPTWGSQNITFCEEN